MFRLVIRVYRSIHPSILFHRSLVSVFRLVIRVYQSLAAGSFRRFCPLIYFLAHWILTMVRLVIRMYR